MTCYETLRAPAPAVDAPMAHHLVKWWRNKFRNGYKKFNLGGDSERTDTEELIGRAASQCSAPPDLLPSEARALMQPRTPPPRRTPTPKPKEHVNKKSPSPTPSINKDSEKPPRLRFEELTCDVELQHPESSKQQPLQFSFTLYDLDGHGRMTKDDIAGIVSTIYETIGKSVTVPHYGSKTIQVRLTVVPENGSERTRPAKPEERRRRRRTQNVQASKPVPHEHAENSEDAQRERLSPDMDASTNSSCSGEHKVATRIPQPRVRHQRHARKDQRERRSAKNRSSSLQRKELLEIIQANMEKNHLSFKNSRKPSESAVIDNEVPNVKTHKHRNRSHTISEKPVGNTFQKTKHDNNRHGYLDLAGGTGDSNLCRYDRYLHAVICSSSKHAHSGYHQKQTPPRMRTSAPPGRSRNQEHPHHNQETHPRVLQIIFL